MGTAATREYLVGSITIEGLDTLPPSYGIGPEDITGCLRAQGTELRPGDVVLVRTGQMRHWPDPASCMRDEPGLTVEGATVLARAGAALIGATRSASNSARPPIRRTGTRCTASCSPRPGSRSWRSPTRRRSRRNGSTSSPSSAPA